MCSLLLILTATTLPSTLRFADAVAALRRGDTIIIPDNAPTDHPSTAKCIYIDDDSAREHGFCNSSPIIPKTPIAWDKALYYLASDELRFDYVWIMEDDVFFTSPKVCVQLVKKYADDASDLIVRNFFVREQHRNWPHWRFAAPFRREHQAGAFLPLCRLSRRMVGLARSFVREHGSLAFVEVMFPSLAVEHKLKVKIMNFIGELRFHAGPAFRRLELLHLWGDNLDSGIFHPVKSDKLRSMSCVRPPIWQLQFSKMVGPFLTRRARLEADLRTNAYEHLTESEIFSMLDDRP
jgi:hypothetical protein